MWNEYIASRLRGRRVLIVEDDYLLALDMAELVRAQGAEVAGPVPSVAEGLSLLLRDRLPDSAILDVRLGRETVFPLVEGLAMLRIPFLFASAYPDWSLPERYEQVPHCEKPIDQKELLQTLAGLSGSSDRPEGGARTPMRHPENGPSFASGAARGLGSSSGLPLRTPAGWARASGPEAPPWSS